VWLICGISPYAFNPKSLMDRQTDRWCGLCVGHCFYTVNYGNLNSELFFIVLKVNLTQDQIEVMQSGQIPSQASMYSLGNIVLILSPDVMASTGGLTAEQIQQIQVWCMVLLYG
jgi:hypothetical protein